MAIKRIISEIVGKRAHKFVDELYIVLFFHY
jgi:hypothetical protein